MKSTDEISYTIFYFEYLCNRRKLIVFFSKDNPELHSIVRCTVGELFNTHRWWYYKHWSKKVHHIIKKSASLVICFWTSFFFLILKLRPIDVSGIILAIKRHGKVFFTLQCKDCECVRTANRIKYRFVLGVLSIFNTLDQNNKQVLEVWCFISAANTVRIYCKRLNSASQRVLACSPLLLNFVGSTVRCCCKTKAKNFET